MTRFLALFNQNTSAQDIFNVADLLQTGGGEILQSWGNSVFIGEASPETQAALSSSPGVAFLTDSFVPDLNFLDIDETAAEVAGAWLLGQTEPFQSAWNDFLNGLGAGEGLLPPDGCGGGADPALDQFTAPINQGGLLGIPANHQVAATLIHRNRRALVGTIGVTVLRIDGPPGSSAEFQLAEWTTALLSLSQGIRILETLAPKQAHLVFDVSIRRARISVDPNTIPSPLNPSSPTAEEYDRIEALWRDPALAQLGAGQGRAGYDDLVRSSSFTFNIDWGFVFVLTKYRAAYPGYTPHYRNVVISYIMEPDLTALPAICAHEIGHTVGALDEYGPGCSVFHRCGFTNTPNLNCEVGNFLSVDCLMKNNKPVVCPSTAAHFGWGDQDFDSVLDPFDPDFILI